MGKGDGARGNLFGKSHLENLKRGQSVRDGGRDGVVGSGQGHGSTYFIRWSRSGQTQAGVNDEKKVWMIWTCGWSQASPQMPHLPRLVCHWRVKPPQ